MNADSNSRHWPMVTMVIAVAALLTLSMITYQVDFTEKAVILRFGKPMTERDTSPGLHGKWPFETVWRVDNRVQCFEGNVGVFEEVFTRDGKNIVVNVFVCWKIAADDAVRFLESVKTVEQAENELTALLRSYKSAVFGDYDFTDLINIDPAQVKISRVEEDILTHLAADAGRLYGINIVSVGIRHIGFPESVTLKVFERMKAERDMEAEKIVSEGDAVALRIRAEAENEREQILADAEMQAKRVRAAGDAEAARHYAVFQEHPELAAFLRKLDALRKTLSEKTTLILDTATAPFDLLDKDAVNLSIPSVKPKSQSE